MQVVHPLLNTYFPFILLILMNIRVYKEIKRQVKIIHYSITEQFIAMISTHSGTKHCRRKFGKDIPEAD